MVKFTSHNAIEEILGIAVESNKHRLEMGKFNLENLQIFYFKKSGNEGGGYFEKVE